MQYGFNCFMRLFTLFRLLATTLPQSAPKPTTLLTGILNSDRVSLITVNKLFTFPSRIAWHCRKPVQTFLFGSTDRKTGQHVSLVPCLCSRQCLFLWTCRYLIFFSTCYLTLCSSLKMVGLSYLAFPPTKRFMAASCFKLHMPKKC